ncbi:hypothetical protein A1F99_016940 [Pyrenophora tritici-repentis]|nr:hypothetical protein A1F99_016940 [Pyrenophora tritici-repentis]
MLSFKTIAVLLALTVSMPGALAQVRQKDPLLAPYHSC